MWPCLGEQRTWSNLVSEYKAKVKHWNAYSRRYTAMLSIRRCYRRALIHDRDNMQYQDDPMQTYGPDRPTDEGYKEERRERERPSDLRLKVFPVP